MVIPVQVTGVATDTQQLSTREREFSRDHHND